MRRMYIVKQRLNLFSLPLSQRLSTLILKKTNDITQLLLI